MNSGRDSIRPLIVSAVAALALHAALAPAMSLYAWSGGVLRSLHKLDAPLPPPEPDAEEPAFGKADGQPSAVAWIAHDDFRELLARQSRTEQPALQQMVDPVDEAPPELDATPPAPTAPPSPQVAPRVPEMPTLAELTPPALRDRPQPFRLDETGDARVPFAPTPLVIERTPAPEPPSTAPAQPAAPPPSEARPTSAARSDRESSPTRLEKFDWTRPGSVQVAKGVEVRTVAPRFGIVARTTAVPVDPEVVIHFDRTGQAVDVTWVRSSGYDNIDAPISRALYQWRASGERIEALKEGETLEFPVRMLLRD